MRLPHLAGFSPPSFTLTNLSPSSSSSSYSSRPFHLLLLLLLASDRYLPQCSFLIFHRCVSLLLTSPIYFLSRISFPLFFTDIVPAFFVYVLILSLSFPILFFLFLHSSPFQPPSFFRFLIFILSFTLCFSNSNPRVSSRVIVDKVVSVGSGRCPRIGSKPTTYSLKTLCHLLSGLKLPTWYPGTRWLHSRWAWAVIWALIWVPL